MDDLILRCHCASMPRRHPHPLPVAHIGWLARKTSTVDVVFQTFNFSFILRGSGWYELDGRRFPVTAPAVITQWPGPRLRYAPTPDWEELYLIYPDSAQDALARCKFLSPTRRWWPLADADALHPGLSELRELLRRPRPEEAVDRIDRCCERLICESLLAAGPRPDPDTTRPETAVREIRRIIERDPLAEHDLAALARERGLSEPWFRRLWRRHYGVPPHRYAMELRLRLACRRLVEGREPIGAIANGLGYPDPLYFARIFKAFTGESASAYRSRHHHEADLAR